MITKTITYENFDGEQVTEKFYFNFNKFELMELLATGFDDILDSIDVSKGNLSLVESQLVIQMLKGIIGKAYLEKASDGIHMVKSEEKSAAFLASDAFSELMFELTSDKAQANAFIAGLLPKKYIQELKKTKPELFES